MRLPGALAALLMLAAACASAQTPPAGVLINRMSSAYRSFGSYRDSAIWKRKAGDSNSAATISLAAEKPNRYALGVKGDKIDSFLVSDGNLLVACRLDSKVYTKTKAPQRIIGADVLAGFGLPAPGARIITMLLEGTLRTADPDLARGLASAQVSAPQGYGDKLAYVLSFRYDLDHDAKAYVTTDDYIVRRVTLYRDGSPVVVETHSDIEVNKPIPSDAFALKPPDGSRMVVELPPLVLTQAASGPAAPDFTLQTVDGGTVSLSSLKGKVVLLNFYFVH